MASGAALRVEEMIKLEFEVRGIIEDLKLCKGPRDVLNRLNMEARERVKKLNAKCKVCYEE